MKPDIEKYENMDPEDRLYEAREKIKRMIIMRVIMAALLVWVIIRFRMPVAMIILLIVVILLILGTMRPAIKVMKTDLKEPEGEELSDTPLAFAYGVFFTSENTAPESAARSFYLLPALPSAEAAARSEDLRYRIPLAAGF